MGLWGAGGVEAFTYLLIYLFLGRAPVASGWMVGKVLHNRETDREREGEGETNRRGERAGRLMLLLDWYPEFFFSCRR